MPAEYRPGTTAPDLVITRPLASVTGPPTVPREFGAAERVCAGDAARRLVGLCADQRLGFLVEGGRTT